MTCKLGIGDCLAIALACVLYVVAVVSYIHFVGPLKEDS
jgi:hypothetical protein